MELKRPGKKESSGERNANTKVTVLNFLTSTTSKNMTWSNAQNVITLVQHLVPMIDTSTNTRNKNSLVITVNKP